MYKVLKMHAFVLNKSNVNFKMMMLSIENVNLLKIK